MLVVANKGVTIFIGSLHFGRHANLFWHYTSLKGGSLSFATYMLCNMLLYRNGDNTHLDVVFLVKRKAVINAGRLITPLSNGMSDNEMQSVFVCAQY